MKERITPDNIQELGPMQIFVFGSNESGIHGAGAAKLAVNQFGAIWKKGFGPQGKSFGIPTKDWDIYPLSLEDINFYIKRFIAYASERVADEFLVTEVACGLAGFKPEEIAPMFKNCVGLPNVHLPQRFWDILNKEE